jgi:hypothetical protein
MKHILYHISLSNLPVAKPLTSPEEAQAFLTAMRDKLKAHDPFAKPPANLSSDGMDDWYLQQKKREQELKKRRQEAENLLRGYRTSYIPNSKDGFATIRPPLSKMRSTSERATNLPKVREVMADPDSDIYEQSPVLGIQRLSVENFEPREGEALQTPNAAYSMSQRPSTPEGSVDPAAKQKPDSTTKSSLATEWRDFVEPGKYTHFTPFSTTCLISSVTYSSSVL